MGSGSCVAVIAANQADAAKIWACDNDEKALSAPKTDAELNQVAIEFCADIDELPQDSAIILMADVLYNINNFALVEKIKTLDGTLIIADFRITNIDDPDFTLFHEAKALTLPKLGEFGEF